MYLSFLFSAAPSCCLAALAADPAASPKLLLPIGMALLAAFMGGSCWAIE